MSISNSSFLNNIAPAASAIFSNLADILELIDVTVKGNEHTVDQGFIYIKNLRDNSSVHIRNGEYSENKTSLGYGGIYMETYRSDKMQL